MSAKTYGRVASYFIDGARVITDGFGAMSRIGGNIADMGSLVNRMNIDGIASTFRVTGNALDATTSGIAATGRVVEGVTGTARTSTEIASELGPAVKAGTSVPIQSIDNAFEAAELASGIANANTVARLTDLGDSALEAKTISNTVNITRRSLDALDAIGELPALTRAAPALKNADEIGGVLKSTSRVVSAADEPLTATRKIADAVDATKTLEKTSGMTAVVTKWGQRVQIAAVSGYLIGSIMSNTEFFQNLFGEEDPDPFDLFTDSEVDIYETAVYGNEKVSTEENLQFLEMLLSKEILIAVSVAILIIVLML